MAKTKPVKVTEYSNWCSYDCYGKPQESGGCTVSNAMKHGEKIEVHWPDNVVEKTKVIVKDESYEGSDMGTRCKIPVTKAYVQVKVHLVTVEVPLRGLKVRKL